MHYPGNNTVPRANFSAPTFQVVYVFRRAVFALSTGPLDGMADKKFRGIGQVNVTIDRH